MLCEPTDLLSFPAALCGYWKCKVCVYKDK